MENEDNKLAEEILEKNIPIRGLIDLGSYSCVGIPYEAAIEAMQAYHEATLRDELIKYDVYVYNHIHTEETSEIFVDQYLKQRTNEKISRRNT
jgi:hypothetical protein